MESSQLVAIWLSLAALAFAKKQTDRTGDLIVGAGLAIAALCATLSHVVP